MNALAIEICQLTNWCDSLERLEPPVTPDGFAFGWAVAEEIARLHSLIDDKNAQYRREMGTVA